jgi:hypothetical protein
MRAQGPCLGLVALLASSTVMAQPLEAGDLFTNGAAVFAFPRTSSIETVDPTLGAGTFGNLDAGAVEPSAPTEDAGADAALVSAPGVPEAAPSVPAAPPPVPPPSASPAGIITAEPESGPDAEVESAAPEAAGPESSIPSPTAPPHPTSSSARIPAPVVTATPDRSAPEETLRTSSSWIVPAIGGATFGSLLVLAATRIRSRRTTR